MGKSHPIELRSRVVAFVEEGNTHREASRHFRVSPRFVNNLVILKRETGSLLPRRQVRRRQVERPWNMVP
jgi:transposase